MLRDIFAQVSPEVTTVPEPTVADHLNAILMQYQQLEMKVKQTDDKAEAEAEVAYRRLEASELTIMELRQQMAQVPQPETCMSTDELEAMSTAELDAMLSRVMDLETRLREVLHAKREADRRRAE
ncbi:hypothetical protein OAO87_01015 [bacterium]|nr:hypothetical protein [bacterium]